MSRFAHAAALAAATFLSAAVPAAAQALPGFYGALGGVGFAYDAVTPVVAESGAPVGAPTGDPGARGGMASLPGTGAGASMDAFGRLRLPGGQGCVDCE